MPIFDKINGLVLTYNGEIYNFPKLKENLIDLGYVFTSNTDTELDL